MKDDHIKVKLAEILECDIGDLLPDRRLDTLQWDSMAMISVMMLAKDRGKDVPGDMLRHVVTVGEVIELL